MQAYVEILFVLPCYVLWLCQSSQSVDRSILFFWSVVTVRLTEMV